jgi:hypothetical protein
MCATACVCTQVDSWGRRPLLLTGCAGMTVALVMLGAIQLPQTAPLLSTWLGHIPSIGLATVNPAAWISVAALLLYVGCYQFSFGPISWLLVGEVSGETKRCLGWVGESEMFRCLLAR